MGTATVVFLIIGGLGAAVLALGVIGAELLHFGHPDIDGPVSTEVLGGFAGAFGFGAAIASELLDANTPTAVLASGAVGALAAVPAAYLAWRLSRAMRNMSTDPTPTRQDLVGCVGVVVTRIPADGYGEVRVRLAGAPVKLNARADKPVPAGTQVFVIAAPSDTSVVVEETRPLAEPDPTS
jgi:membrane protein implicated in regulation of membrane protease activity